MESIPYSILQSRCETENRRPTYIELLSTKEWLSKRYEIINRDKRCTNCGCTETDRARDFSGKFHNFRIKEVFGPLLFEESSGINDTLGTSVNIRIENYYMEMSDNGFWYHIHHKYYILSKLPWEYENDALITLCNKCHNEWHSNNVAPVYELINNGLVAKTFTICNRCNGAGVFLEYKHVQNGICFTCKGYKYLEVIDKYAI